MTARQPVSFRRGILADLDFAMPLYDAAHAAQVQRDAAYLAGLGRLIEAGGWHLSSGAGGAGGAGRLASW